MLRNERTDSNHVGFELNEVLDVLDKAFQALEWRPNHDAGPHLIIQFLEPIQALESMPDGHALGMQEAVMTFVVSLVSQQVAVSSGIAPQGISISWMFAKR